MSDAGAFIPVGKPDLGGNEEAYVVQAVRSTWIGSSGDFVHRFERDFAAFAGTRAAIAVCNGTAALHLLLATLQVGPGDEVIVPSLTFVATANAVRYVGALPVFADIDPRTWCIDPMAIEARITARTKGIIAVHLYGHPADMDAIEALARRHGLWILEDAAQAHGARYKGRPVGGLAAGAAFSFYASKIVAAGEAGAVTLNDPALESRARLLRGQGMDPERHYYFPVIGFNFRPTNIACALLCAQLERVQGLIAQRRRVFASYREGLSGVPGIGFQPVAPWAEPAPWSFCITVEEEAFGMSRDALRTHLAHARIETRPFFLPLHTLPPYSTGSTAGGGLPATVRLAARGLSLPTYPQLSAGDIERIVAAVRAAPRQHA